MGPAVSLHFVDEDIPRAKQTLSLQPQHTSADGSFRVKAKHFSLPLILLCLYRSYLLHGFPPSAFSVCLCSSMSILPFRHCSICWIVTGWSSQHTLISRCLILQKCISEELVFKATVHDRAELNIVECFVTSPPEHQLLCI